MLKAVLKGLLFKCHLKKSLDAALRSRVDLLQVAVPACEKAILPNLVCSFGFL